MAVRRYQFDSFSLDPIERRLFAGEVLAELNRRYFDALLLLLQHPGRLSGRLGVHSSRFLACDRGRFVGARSANCGRSTTRFTPPSS
jgi:hypothetical protein